MPVRRPAATDPAAAPGMPQSAAATRLIRSMRRTRIERRTALIAGGAVAGLWLLVVFAGALADASTQAARLKQEQAVNAGLRAQVDAGSAEIQQIQARGFQDFLARAYGMGEPAERPYALQAGAPPPPSMVPLGEDPATTTTSTPLEDWLDLLLGR
ncbi:MAG: hypothetical protein U0869_20800 [Chloroflexota bacterium]